MLNFLSENRAPFLAVLLLVLFLVLLSIQIRSPDTTSGVESAILAVLSPVVRAGSGAVDGAGGLWSDYVDLVNLREENERLRRELSAFKLEHQRLDEAALENARLHDLLALQHGMALPTAAAKVIRLELGGPFRLAILDRGSDHGIRPDDAVINPDGVVGRVTEVAGRVCRVQLLVDTSSGAAAMISRTREQGMVIGRRVNELEMQYLSALAQVQIGDAVDTSGLDGIYPKGFRLGHVTAVAGGDRLQQRLNVETAVDFRRLEEVLVVIRPPAATGGERAAAPATDEPEPEDARP